MFIKRLDEKIKVRIMLLVMFIINLSWFSTYKFHTLIGDDLNSWNNFKNYSFSAWHYVFLQVYANKYRPVFSFVQYILFKLFGQDFLLYYYFSIALNFIIAFLFFKIIKLITRNIYIAFLFSVMYITARFSYYNILQLTGVMEGIGLLLFVAIIYCALLFYKENNVKYLYWLIFYDLLIVFTHERYLVLTPIIILLVFFKNGIKTDLNKKLKYSILSSLSFLIYILAKFSLHSHTFEGTGGSPIDINLKSIIGYIKSGSLNLFGFNDGATYLSGQSYQDSTHLTLMISTVILFLILFIISLYVKNTIKQKQLSCKKREILIGMFFVLVVGTLLFVSSITIRQEFRWLYAPYVIFLIFIAYSLNKSIKSHYLKYAILILLVIFTVRNDNYYKQKMRDVFFIGYQITMDSMYDETIKKYGTNLSEYKLYIQKDDSLDFPLYGQLYFKVYTNDPKFEFQYVKDISEVNFGANDRVIFLKLDPVSKKMIHITEK